MVFKPSERCLSPASPVLASAHKITVMYVRIQRLVCVCLSAQPGTFVNINGSTGSIHKCKQTGFQVISGSIFEGSVNYDVFPWKPVTTNHRQRLDGNTRWIILFSIAYPSRLRRQIPT
ncbi:hypothetical protein HZ326_3982 [Fusarium oxysporum f. sp. albedinis]|nr:hypothetical protein HZ326_3982 [Fusarium oxysporum f. sp. albedinis]